VRSKNKTERQEMNVLDLHSHEKPSAACNIDVLSPVIQSGEFKASPLEIPHQCFGIAVRSVTVQTENNMGTS
jgi:hypothetical protein